jgi:hypothetical protein
VTKNSFGEEEVLLISMPVKKVPECRSGLRRSEKDLPQRHSGAIGHKNTPALNR